MRTNPKLGKNFSNLNEILFSLISRIASNDPKRISHILEKFEKKPKELFDPVINIAAIKNNTKIIVND